jgi:hypothetical protein
LPTMTCANNDAPAELLAIGCGGLVAVLMVQAQAHFLHTSSITINWAGTYS